MSTSFFRSQLFSTIFAVILGTVLFANTANTAIAEEDTLGQEIESFHTTTTKTEPSVTINAMEEEEEFQMDLSTPVPAQNIGNPDDELVVTPSVVSSAATTVSRDASLDIEDVPPPVDEAAKAIEWNLNLEEDLEKITPVQQTEEKSAPVNLEYLEE